MTPADARAVIEPAVATWANGQNVTVAWPNVPFTPPAGSWVKLDFVWGTGQVMTKGGGGLNSVTGILQLAIFGRKNKGDGALDTLAQSARATFNRLRFASPNQDVMFGAVSGPVRRDEESWRSLVVSAPFTVHEIVP